MDPSAKKVFLAWVKIRQSPNALAALKSERWRYIVLFIVVALGSGASAFIFPEEAMFALGIGVGVLIGIIASIEQRMIALRKNWPVLEEVVDWTKLENMLKEEPNQSSQPTPTSRRG